MNPDSPVWRPHSDWERVGGAEGAATVGVWRVRDGGADRIVKRVRRDSGSRDLRSHRWLQREVEVARSGIASSFKGLAAPSYRIEEDDAGVSLWSNWVPHDPPTPPTVAKALAAFGSVPLPDPGWFVTGRLRDRITATAPNGVHRLLTVLDTELYALVCSVWDRREAALDQLDRLPQVLAHGDALPRNLLRYDPETDRVLAIDWDQIGYNAVGADLATYWMWTPVDAERLVVTYADALAHDIASRREVAAGFDLTVSLIAVMRAARSQNTRGYHDRLLRAHTQLERAARLLEGPVSLTKH